MSIKAICQPSCWPWINKQQDTNKGLTEKEKMINNNNIIEKKYTEYLEFFNLEECPAVANMHCNLVRIYTKNTISFSKQLTKESHNFDIKQCRFCKKNFIECCSRPIYSLPRWGAVKLDTFYYTKQDKRIWYYMPWGGNNVWHPCFFVMQDLKVLYIHVEMGVFFKLIRIPTQNKLIFSEISWDHYLKD